MSKENETKTETEDGYGEGTLTEEELLMLDSLLYYEEFSNNDYDKIEGFIKNCIKDNSTSVMNGVLSDDDSSLSRMVEYISQNDKLMNLQIVYRSSQTNLAGSNAVCL